jgi:glycosyltransferase involved in cell wall biosynthesis
VLLAGDYPPDERFGSSRVLLRLAAEMVAMGHDVRRLLADELAPWVPGARLRPLFVPRVLAARHDGLARASGEFDVVDVSGGDGAALFSRLARRGAATACIARSHGLEHRWYQAMLDDHRLSRASKPWYRRILFPLVRLPQVEASIRSADAAIVAASPDRDHIVSARWLPPGRVHVVMHGLDPVVDRAVARTRDLLFAGSWILRKGTVDLVRAFTNVARVRPDVRLTVAGTGVNASEVRAAFPAALSGRIDVIERLAPEEMAEAYASHRILVFPSTFEGFGLVVPEAMAAGCVPVSTPVGAVPDLVRHDADGLIVPPRDPDAFAAAVIALLADPERLARLAASARARSRSLSWQKAARDTLRVYEEALSERARASGRGRADVRPRAGV